MKTQQQGSFNSCELLDCAMKFCVVINRMNLKLFIPTPFWSISSSACSSCRPGLELVCCGPGVFRAFGTPPLTCIRGRWPWWGGRRWSRTAAWWETPGRTFVDSPCWSWSAAGTASAVWPSAAGTCSMWCCWGRHTHRLPAFLPNLID